MNLQYISDSTGKTTGVFIPIKEWDEIKSKYKGIEKEETDIPNWHKETLKKRIASYKKNPDSVIDFDSAINEIEKNV